MGRFTGKDNPFYGKKHTEESKEKNRQAHLGNTNKKGKKVSEEGRKPVS